MTGFSDSELTAIATLARMIVPASAQHEIPAADDPRILAEIVAALRPGRDRLAGALADVDGLPGETDEVRGRIFQDSHPDAARMIQTAVAECYYRDVRVLASLGMAPRPPFPAGHDIEPGDFSLLDPVRTMPPRWRKA